MTKRDKPYLYVTWITKLLAGDDKCEWAAWFKANHQDYEKLPRSIDSTEWTGKHSAALNAKVDELRAAGFTVYVEDQNKFTIKGQAANFGGKPDLVAVNGDYVLVIDTKTGKQKDCDIWQVLIYMMVLPMTHSACMGKLVNGELSYPNDVTLEVPAERLNDTTKDLITTMIKRIVGDEPRRTPSAHECKFCEIAMCPDRVKEETKPVETKQF